VYIVVPVVVVPVHIVVLFVVVHIVTLFVVVHIVVPVVVVHMGYSVEHIDMHMIVLHNMLGNVDVDILTYHMMDSVHSQLRTYLN
jgi:hypothetical protein